MEEKDDGKIRDLTGKLQRGEITRKEAYKILREMGLTEKESFSTCFKVFEIIVWIAYFVLWLLPMFSISSKLDFLVFFAQLQTFIFPLVVVYVSIFDFNSSILFSTVSPSFNSNFASIA